MLDTLRHQPYPFGSFAITVDKSGQGHLQSYIDPHRVAKMPGMKDSVILDWTERTSYLIDGKGRTQLSLEVQKSFGVVPENMLFMIIRSTLLTRIARRTVKKISIILILVLLRTV
jgi:hypothetical protein